MVSLTPDHFTSPSTRFRALLVLGSRLVTIRPSSSPPLSLSYPGLPNASLALLSFSCVVGIVAIPDNGNPVRFSPPKMAGCFLSPSTFSSGVFGVGDDSLISKLQVNFVEWLLNYFSRPRMEFGLSSSPLGQAKLMMIVRNTSSPIAT